MSLAPLKPSLRSGLVESLARLHPALVERRRDFHRHPELGFEETRTSAIVAAWLRELGLEVREGVAKTGVVARIRGKYTGKTVAIRADMDALPIVDAKRCDYASEERGKMHACGHDGHMTIALGAASLLAGLRDELRGDVVFLFQPAEEGPGGALPMIEAGALDGVDFIFGQHMTPLLPAGEVAIAEGPALAASDLFTIRVLGTGGHGAYPHRSVDAIPIAAQIVTAMQTIVSRTVDPLASAVVSIGTMRGGYNYNVIADVVEMTGTIRTFDPVLRDELPKRIDAIARGVAEAHGGRADVTHKRGYPATVNPREGAALFRAIAGDALGASHVHEAPPSMGGEDFSYYLQRIPGCFSWLGCRHPTPVHEGYNIHHPAFDLDEASLPIGARLFAEGALRFLSSDVAAP